MIPLGFPKWYQPIFYIVHFYLNKLTIHIKQMLLS